MLGPRMYGMSCLYFYYMEKCLSNRAESVPVSKLPQLVQETKQDLAESGLKAGIVGHVGDGECLLVLSSKSLMKFHPKAIFIPSSYSRTMSN